MTSPLAAVSAYDAALAAGDMAALAAALHPQVVWHQPGTHPYAGDHTGPEAVLAHLGSMMGATAGSLVVRPTDAMMANGDLVTFPVHFTGTRPGDDRAALDMAGSDLFRVEDGLIREVWLFSADQTVEDAFWA